MITRLVSKGTNNSPLGQKIHPRNMRQETVETIRLAFKQSCVVWVVVPMYQITVLVMFYCLCLMETITS